MQHQPGRIGAAFIPQLPGCDRIGIPIEGVHHRTGIQEGPRIATSAEGGVDHHIAGLQRKRRNHFIKEDRNVRRRHLRFALARASVSSSRQSACWPAQLPSMA